MSRGICLNNVLYRRTLAPSSYVSIVYPMKPMLSFVLFLPPSTSYATFESVVDNLLKNVCMMLDSGKV